MTEPMTNDELHALPVSVDLVTAARAFGLGRTKAFELAKQDRFPCRIIRVGEKYRVPRSAIFEALGVDPADAPARPPRRSSPKRRPRSDADLDPRPAA